MKHIFYSLLVIGLLVPSLNAQSVECQECIECQQCDDAVAVGLYKKTSAKKTVFEVTEKEIAVPDICLPKPLFRLKEQFQKLCGKPCVPGKPCGCCEVVDCPKHVRNGKVKVIKVMKKTSVKCAKCEHEWEVTKMEKVNEYLYPPAKSDDSDSGKAAAEPTKAEPPAAMEKMPQQVQPLLELDQPPVAPEITTPPSVSFDHRSSKSAFLIRHPLRSKSTSGGR